MKSDRRFFQTRLRELIAQGVIEKVQVPRAKGERGKEKFVSCIRLLNASDQDQAGSFSLHDREGMPALHAFLHEQPHIASVDSDELPTLKSTVTFHRQMVDLIHKSGTEGITLGVSWSEFCQGKLVHSDIGIIASIMYIRQAHG